MSEHFLLQRSGRPGEDKMSAQSSFGSSLSTISSLGSDYQSIPEESLIIPPSWLLRGVTVNLADIRGKGSYGTVFVAHWHGSEVAAKKLHDIFFEFSVVPEAKRGILRAFAKELNILFQLKHPNIVQFYGVFKPSGSLSSLELSHDSYLIQELMWSALDVRNRAKPKLNLRNVVEISLGIASALQYLHDRNEPIIHRDLATKNVLLSSSGTAKISDLGVAKVIQFGEQSLPQTRQPGTELYMPPEVKIEGLSYSTSVDIFSFGVIMLEICIGHDVTASEAFRVGELGMVRLVPEVERRKRDFQDLSNHVLKPLIMQCLDTCKDRPTANAIWERLTRVKDTAQYKSAPESRIVPTLEPVQPSLNQQSSRALSARCEMLEEKVSVLQGDKQHLEKKLNSYMQTEREESEPLHQEIERVKGANDRLRAEIDQLRATVRQKEVEISELTSFSSPPSSLTDPQSRDQRATLLHRVNTLHANVSRLEKQIQALEEENLELRQQQKMHNGSSGHSSSGPSSLPTLSSWSNQHSGLSKSVSDDSISAKSEIKQLKKMIDKLKTVNVELDMKLKDANLRLQEYGMRQTDSDVMYRMEAEHLRAENERLRLQLESVQQENYSLLREITACRPY